MGFEVCSRGGGRGNGFGFGLGFDCGEAGGTTAGGFPALDGTNGAWFGLGGKTGVHPRKGFKGLEAEAGSGGLIALMLLTLHPFGHSDSF